MMSKLRLFWVVAATSILPGCGESPYCCAVDKVSKDLVYTAEYRSQLSKVAAAEDEDVCQSYVDANFDRFEEALSECVE